MLLALIATVSGNVAGASTAAARSRRRCSRLQHYKCTSLSSSAL